MPAVLIKDVPKALHRQLRERALKNRRSMNQELLVLLEGALEKGADAPRSLPPAAPTSRKLTDAWLKKAIRRGRA